MRISEVVKKQDIEDAKSVLNDWMLYYNARIFTDPNIVFDEGLKNAFYKKMPLDDLKIFADHGRRTSSKNDIIVGTVQREDRIIYQILDGQHRFLTAKEKGLKEIKCYIIPLNIKWSKQVKKWLVGGDGNLKRDIW